MNSKKQQTGFTIIEVVLVLAIAALIFLMVFIALPALQRGQANTARKSDMSSVAAAITSYRSNTNGDLPSTYKDISPYIDKLAQVELPPDTEAIPTLAAADDKPLVAGRDTLDTIKIYKKARCDGATKLKVGSSRQASVLTVVQTGTADTSYTTVCQDA